MEVEKSGLHILARLILKPDYRPPVASELVAKICSLVDESGMTRVGEVDYQFDSHSVTLCVLLAESHVSLHTWYERGYVDADIFVCGVTKDNRQSAEKFWMQLVQYFNAEVENEHRIAR